MTYAMILICQEIIPEVKFILIKTGLIFPLFKK